VSGLPPSHYDIAISAPGFATYNAKNFVLGVAQKARLDAKLQVGTGSLQITVAGEDVSTVETQSSELAGTVTGRENHLCSPAISALRKSLRSMSNGRRIFQTDMWY